MAATWAYHFIDGFDHQLAADTPKKYSTGSAGTQIATANTRFGRGYGMDGGSYTIAFGATNRTWRWAAAIKRDPSMGADRTLVSLNESANVVCDARLTTAGHIQIRRGDGTVLGTALSVVPASTWLWVEIILYIDNSAGVALVFVSDVVTPVLTLTGVDTQNGSNDFADRADCGTLSGIGIDDFHVSAGSGSPVAGDALPDSTIITNFAVTQGDYSDFTPDSGTNHVDRVRDATAGTLADGDSSYLTTNAAGDKESMLFDDLPADVTDINMVQITAMIRKNDAAGRTFKVGTRRSGTDYESGSQNAADTYLFAMHTQVVDPVTSAAWTRTNVNGTQGMVNLIS